MPSLKRPESAKLPRSRFMPLTVSSGPSAVSGSRLTCAVPFWDESFSASSSGMARERESYLRVPLNSFTFVPV